VTKLSLKELTLSRAQGGRQKFALGRYTIAIEIGLKLVQALPD